MPRAIVGCVRACIACWNFDLLADSRLVVGHEIKLYVEVEVVEVAADAPTAAAA
ncbi:MAG TPA: hypothetical protein VGL99_01605 [Chloroflexota bacterium]